MILSTDPAWTQEGGGDLPETGNDLDDVALGVSKSDLDLLRKSSPSAINENLLKKVLNVHQVRKIFEY